MTAREFAKERGVELIGKLTKKTVITKEWDWAKGEEVEVRTPYWIDEAGNEVGKGKKGGWYLITADGDVY